MLKVGDVRLLAWQLLVLCRQRGKIDLAEEGQRAQGARLGGCCHVLVRGVVFLRGCVWAKQVLAEECQ